jgi:hypothetical protein
MIIMATPRTAPRDAAMVVEWSGGQGVGHDVVVVLHPLLVGEGGEGVGVGASVVLD